MPVSSKWSPSFRFPHQKPVHTCLLSHHCAEQCLMKTLPSFKKPEGDRQFMHSASH